MDLHILSLPYDSARAHWRMGRGPERFLQGGLEASLSARGHFVAVTQVDSSDPNPSEIKTAFELYRSLAVEVRRGSTNPRSPEFPLVLSGNCGAAIGTLAGLPFEPLGIVWFDAHGDFNTPDTTLSGYLDGMGLATACGLCWTGLASTIPGFRPIPGENVLHIGGSDLDVGENRLMVASGVQRVSTRELLSGGLDGKFATALAALSARVKDIYLHLDLDVLDPIAAPANHFPASEGLPVEVVREAIRRIKAQFTLCALGVASYDPDYDPTGSTLRAGMELIESAVG